MGLIEADMQSEQPCDKTAARMVPTYLVDNANIPLLINLPCNKSSQ